MQSLEIHIDEYGVYQDVQNPPGVATMTRLKSEIRCSVSEVPYGAMIRIQTSNPETTDAVHAFPALSNLPLLVARKMGSENPQSYFAQAAS